MSDPPNKYKIETLCDFLKVPEDRIDVCLEEFKEHLKIHRGFQNIADLVVGALGNFSPFERELEASFTWIDDGKREKTISLEVKKR